MVQFSCVKSSGLFSSLAKGSALALALLMLAGCQTKQAAKPQPAQAPQLEASAKGVFGTPGSVWVVFNNPTQQIRFEDGKVTGFGGCNNFSASVKFSGAFVKFGPVLSTKKGCDDEINQKEIDLFDRFSRAHTFHGSSVRASVLEKSGIELIKFIQPR